MLQDMGIPIEAVRGPAGGYRLRPGFKLPPLMLTDDEGLAITLSLIAARRQGIPADPHMIEGALAKIERVLPAALRQRLQAVQASVAFHATPAPPQPRAELVLLLSTAIHQHRRVQLRYQAQREETQRGVDPYGLVSHWDHWYLVGWCRLRRDVRVFRLDRIADATLEEATFTPPDAFDSLTYVLESLARARSGWQVEVLLETTLAEMERRIEPGNVLLEATDGGVVMRAHVDQLDLLARWLIMLNCPFVIRQPQQLRETMIALAADLMAQAARTEADVDAAPHARGASALNGVSADLRAPCAAAFSGSARSTSA
jgi:predicted DNA-binding transcriptional regulator YafY